MSPSAAMRVALIGCAGVPNRYGGFESFVEHCGPEIATAVREVVVTCDARLYPDREPLFKGMRRVFVPVPANGAWSVLHDLLAFLSIFRTSTHIVVLGVSGGPWFAVWRALCAATGKTLVVNIDGVEWRRAKFSRNRRRLLRLFDALAQRSAHRIVYDSPALLPLVLEACRPKARYIAYSGDHVLRLPQIQRRPNTALTICRIEPENQVAMIIEGALAGGIESYIIVGNWSHSQYGRELRARYAGELRLQLRDPVYEPQAVAELRESCSVYIHGHSVGGTNPSLVEMLFYDCALACFDCAFNRETAGDCAGYFADAAELARLLGAGAAQAASRELHRSRFTRERIAERYLETLAGA